MVDNTNSNELYHHGVLGMKWGVHRNPQKAFEKASKKANKLNSQVEKVQHKVDKAAAKRDKMTRRYTGFGFAGKKDVANAQVKYDKVERKLAKKRKKAEKWMAKMDETFKNVKISDI